MPFATYKRVNGTAPWPRLGATAALRGVILGFRVWGSGGVDEGTPIKASFEVVSEWFLIVKDLLLNPKP